MAIVFSLSLIAFGAHAESFEPDPVSVEKNSCPVVINNAMAAGAPSSCNPNVVDFKGFADRVLSGVLNVDIATSVTDWIQLLTVVITLGLLLQTTHLSRKSIEDGQKTQELIAKDNSDLQERIHSHNRQLLQHQIKQKDRELRQVLAENRMRWMQEIRAAYSDFAATVYGLMSKRMNSADVVTGRDINIQDVISKAINFNILLNPVDDIHVVVIKMKEGAMAMLMKDDFAGADAMFDKIGVMIQFIIRLEWMLAKLEMSKFGSQSLDDEKFNLVKNWAKKNPSFKAICDEYGIPYF